jgi:hypothetical protein
LTFVCPQRAHKTTKHPLLISDVPALECGAAIFALAVPAGGGLSADSLDTFPQLLRGFVAEEGQKDFLNAAFTAPGETMAFVQGMVTETAALQIQAELRKLRQKMAELHQDALAVPLKQRRGTGLLFALREWEPAGFTKLRRSNQS